MEQYRRAGAGWQRAEEIPGFWRDDPRRIILSMNPAVGGAARVRWKVMALGALALVCTGCSAPQRRADFGSTDPSERSAAAAKAATERDRGAVADLIVMLDSSDPAARMIAIAALERITGERLGYDPTADRAARNEAVDRWVRFAIEQGYTDPSGPREWEGEA